MSVQDWRSGFGVFKPGESEVISQALWERLTYVSAATTQLVFFPRVPANEFAGNLQLAGQLPSNNYFLIMSIRIAPFPDVTETADAATAAGAADGALQDVTALVRQGIAQLRVGDKDYGGPWPLFMLPGGGGGWGSMGNVGTSAAGSASQFQHGLNGAPDPRQVYSLPVPLMIPPLYNFSMQLNWPAALTLVGGNTDIFVILDGEIMRPVQ